MKRFLPSFLFLPIFLVYCMSASCEEVARKNYACKDLNGNNRWQAEIKIIRKTGNLYSMVEKAQGLYSGFSDPISWIAEMEYENTDDNIRPLSLDKRVFDNYGNLIRRETQRFDLASNTGICTHEDFARNIRRTRHFTFKKDVVNRLSLTLYIQKFLQKGKAVGDAQLVSEEPNSYDVKLTLEKKEAVEINGLKKSLYRLCIDPQLGLISFVKVFFVKTYTWHFADSGFEWYRYRGPEGGVLSEKVEVTLEN